jgi:hypothetical protein
MGGTDCGLSECEPAGENVHFDPVDPAGRRGLAFHSIDQGSDCAPAAADADQDSLGVVEHLSGQAKLTGQAPNSPPETHTLHAATHPEFHRQRLRRWRGATMRARGCASQR